jgi:DNA-binding MarR family transcriptional regulator
LRASTRLLAEFEVVFGQHGTSSLRFDVLDALQTLGRPARPVEIRALLHLPAQTVTGIVDALERDALVRRRPNPDDRRSILVELTPAAGALIGRLVPPLVELQAACMSGLSSAELERLVDLLARVQRTIDGLQAAPARLAGEPPSAG